MIFLSSTEVAIYYSLRMPDLRQRAKRWRGPCPIHRGKRDSFSVDPETGLWRCWSNCGRGGGVIAMEIALTGAAWRDAVMQIEQIIGRPLLDRPASHEERRALAERRAREQRDLRDAEVWRIATAALAGEILDRLPDGVPDRYAPTQLLLQLRALRGTDLIALFHDWLARDPRLTTALVYAGARARQRQCDRLARFIVAGAQVNDAA